MKALAAAFIEIRTQKFAKKVSFKPGSSGELVAVEGQSAWKDTFGYLELGGRFYYADLDFF